MKKILFSILIGTCFVSFARLGESQIKCEQRYGKPVFSDKQKRGLINPDEAITCRYQKGGLGIEITFIKSKAVKIKYSHLDASAFKETFKSDTGLDYKTFLEDREKFENETGYKVKGDIDNEELEITSPNYKNLPSGTQKNKTSKSSKGL